MGKQSNQNTGAMSLQEQKARGLICSTCSRAKLLCACVGGGSGAEGGDGEDYDGADHTSKFDGPTNALSVKTMLTRNPLWKISEDSIEFNFTPEHILDKRLNSTFFLKLVIIIDPNLNKFECKPKPGALLTADEQTALRAWYKEIKSTIQTYLKVNDISDDSVKFAGTDDKFSFQTPHKPELFSKILVELQNKNLLTKDDSFIVGNGLGDLSQSEADDPSTAPIPSWMNTNCVPTGYDG
jgi:hypothetical protein